MASRTVRRWPTTSAASDPGGTLPNGLLHGTTTIYGTDGRVVKTIEYENGSDQEGTAARGKKEKGGGCRGKR
jgi:hypothetical protein